MRVQMLGLCRFSYLGMRGFQVDHATLAERRAFLYDPERLRRRWYWFKHIALPAWQAQTDPDFTLVVMTGPDLPEPYLSRLQKLARGHDWMRLEIVAPMDRHLEACLAALRPHLDLAADVIGHFRHDDDDAVAIDYIASARAGFQDVRGLWARDKALCLDHARGVMAGVSDGQLVLTPRITHNATAAMTIFLPPDLPRSAVHFEHWKVGLWMPNVAITRDPMFLRLIHDDADSGDMGAGYGWPAAPDAWPALLRQRFRVDIADLERGARRFARGGRGGGSG